MPKSKTDSWSTPPKLYESLHKEFCFDDYDPCPLNHEPDSDGLIEEWAPVTFVNPPYSKLKSTKKQLGWVDKAHLESQKGKTVVMLIPARTDTTWFHDVNVEHSFTVGSWKKLPVLSYNRFHPVAEWTNAPRIEGIELE